MKHTLYWAVNIPWKLMFIGLVGGFLPDAQVPSFPLQFAALAAFIESTTCPQSSSPNSARTNPMRQYTWRILSKRMHARKSVDKWLSFCALPCGDLYRDAAYVIRDALRKEFPSASFMATDRPDWNKCFNSKPTTF
jgi:hypothetical protein